MNEPIAKTTDRRNFIAGCGRLVARCTLFGCAGSLIVSSKHCLNDGLSLSLTGICREELYRDADSCIYIVELANGECTIGFGPANLETESTWESSDRVEGHVPSVIYHRELGNAARTRLDKKLAGIA